MSTKKEKEKSENLYTDVSNPKLEVMSFNQQIDTL